MAGDRWKGVTTERGKPRVYIQQYLDLKLSEQQYKKICQEMGLEKPFTEEAATTVMEAFLEDLADGSQCDTAHLQRSGALLQGIKDVYLQRSQVSFHRKLNFIGHAVRIIDD